MTVLVTGVGGMVGQGVLKNIHRSYKDRFTIIGTDVNHVTCGNHLCDKLYKVAPAYQDYVYKNMIHEICTKEEVRLIIPTTDLEGYHLTRFRIDLDCTIVAALHRIHQ